jgi:DNA-binding Xre family transcriptional regulator
MTKKLSIKPRRLQWRARVVMAERGIRSVSALSRTLNSLGVDISESQLGRIIDGKSSHFNSTVVGALLTALDCGLNDLLVVS